MQKVTDKDFIQAWEKYKSPTKVAEALGLSVRTAFARRRSLESKGAISLDSGPRPQDVSDSRQASNQNPARVHCGVENGTVIVFSDAHFWSDYNKTTFKSLLWAIKELKPKIVIANGDIFDGAQVSRHPRIGWDSTPSVIDELKACEAALGEIEEAAISARRNTKLIWTLGNHDARFENMLAANAPQYQFVKGFSLKDHFPAWQPCWSCWPTENVVVKHRFKGGIHATHNNTLWAGKSMVTGHLHSLKVTPFSDYNGTRFGVDTGTLAEVGGSQFINYLEDAPVNWRSGFAILTFFNGKLLWPELVHKWGENQVEFRGQIINV